MTRILLCVGEPILAKGLEDVLRQVEGFELLPTCRGVTALMELPSKSVAPDLVLLDLTRDVSFAVMSELKRTMRDIKIVLWVKSVSTELAFQAMGLGVRGILRKQLPVELQVKCLQRVQAGELWFEKALTDSFLSSRRVTLSSREGELVSLLAQGLKNKEIAAALTVSENTVKVYLSRLFEKAGVKDRFELALFGLKNLTTWQPPQGEEGQRSGQRSGGGLSSLLGRSEPKELPERYAAGGVRAI